MLADSGSKITVASSRNRSSKKAEFHTISTKGSRRSVSRPKKRKSGSETKINKR